MLKAKDIHGVIPAIVTPFTSSDKVDVKALKAITRYALELSSRNIDFVTFLLHHFTKKA